MAPFKRVRQPKIPTQALLDFDLGESSSDSDFRIEDHCSDGSKDGDEDEGDSGASSSTSSDDSDDDSGEAESDDSTKQLHHLLTANEETDKMVNGNVDDLEAKLKQLDSKKDQTPKLPMKPLCCVCLGERSDDSNEIIECDGCSVSVHEGCYGVGDNVSISSTNSTCSTEPWFCEACRAGVSEPTCELCPNTGGIYKETDVGKWVHLVCALYVPGVAFGEVEQLSSVTLFEMQYNKWGAKVCSLCENTRFARTGVCIGCDAGMCKTYFHVTCAQAAGFLTEAHHEEADAADPFYAHCKVHSEKEMVKKRKRNYHSIRLNMQEKSREKLALRLDDPSPAQMRIQRKLLKYQRKYAGHKQVKAEPWVPTQKMSRLLTTSASACKRLLAKAAVMSVDVELMERQEAQIAALTDIRKKWHIAPAFSVEFIGYYLDRISRTEELKQQLAEMLESNTSLTKEQDRLRAQYDAQLDDNKLQKLANEKLITNITELHKHVMSLCPSKILPSTDTIGRPQPEPPKMSTPPQRPISVPTAAALKMGVGFPLAHLGPPGTKVDSTRLLSTHAKNTTNNGSASSAPTTPTLGVHNFDCGICKRFNDQHLLAKCDTCKLHYHLGCLNPPLTRHPKKSKLYGWQCSECDRSDGSDVASELPKGPRKSRTRFNKEGFIVPVRNGDKSNESSGRESTLGKRRSMDSLPTYESALISRKPLNKTLPAAVHAWANDNPLNKKLKIELEDPIKSMNINLRNSLQGTPQPIIVDLSANESLMLELPQTSIMRHNEESDCNIMETDPLTLHTTIANNSLIVFDDSFDSCSKQSRKQKRKDKHKNKHNIFLDTDKSPNKEHKRKRKKKLYDVDQTPSDSALSTGCIPKIKIKFKTLPLPGEDTPEAQFFYVSADAVRSAEEASRPTSVETVEEITPLEPSIQLIAKAQLEPAIQLEPLIGEGTLNENTLKPAITVTNNSPTRKVSPRKANARKSFMGRPKSTPAGQKAVIINCCVCTETGKQNTVVTCDECRKHYHFACLDPPMKKSPKIRGYSWHCAACEEAQSDDDNK